MKNESRLLRTYRIQRNLKAIKVSNDLNISYTYLWQVESGGFIPSDRLKFKIIKYLKLTNGEIKSLWPDFYKEMIYKPSFADKLKNLFAIKK